MCNLYSETKGQAAIRALFRAARDGTGNLPAFPGIFPDQMAPIVRNGAEGANSSWPAGACQAHRSLAASRSPTSATSRARTGAGGWLEEQLRRPTTWSCEYARSSRQGSAPAKRLAIWIADLRRSACSFSPLSTSLEHTRNCRLTTLSG